MMYASHQPSVFFMTNVICFSHENGRQSHVLHMCMYSISMYTKEKQDVIKSSNRALNMCCLNSSVLPLLNKDVYLSSYYFFLYVNKRYDMSSTELLFGRGGAVGSQVQPDDVTGWRIFWCGLRSISSYIWGERT